MVTVFWRSQLDISKMRCFATKHEAFLYGRTITLNPRNLRIYELSPDKEPVLLKDQNDS